MSTVLKNETSRILGHDSLGNPIGRGDGILVFNETRNKTIFDFAKGTVKNVATLRVYDALKKEVVLPVVERIKLHRSCNIDIDELCEKSDDYWKELDGFIFDEQRLKSRTRGEDWYNRNFPNFQLQGRMTDSVKADRIIGYFSRVKRTSEGYELDILYPGEENKTHVLLKIGDTRRIGSGISIVSLVKQEKSKHAYLQVHNLFLDSDSKNLLAKPLEIPRLSSDDEVIKKLKSDFPWLKKEDIYPIGEHIPVKDIKKKVTPIDRLRLKRLYRDFNPNLIKGIKDLTEAEEVYLASRNYLHLVEFADYVKNKDGDVDRLGLLSSSEKTKLVEDFLSRIQKERDVLLRKRKDKEFKLFGFEVSVIPEYAVRQVSQETISPKSYLGLHYGGNITFLVDKPHEYYKDGNLYRKFVEIQSHEEGHLLKAKSRNSDWKYEEMWNEWFSVVYPRALNNDFPEKGDVLYQHEVLEQGGIYFIGRKNHGAFELQKAFQELIDLTETGEAIYRGKKLTRQDIERSAIISFIRRSDRGEILFGKLKTVGFADLYDEVKYNISRKSKASTSLPYRLVKKSYKSAFDERFLHCTDQMYERVGKTNKNKKIISEEPMTTISADASEVLQQIYNILYKEKILKEDDY